MSRFHLVRLVGVFGFVFAGASQAAVFVNEIHYDNAGTDVGEAVEVVATGGENLGLYSLVLYNGSGGVQYDTDPVPPGVSVTCGAQVQIATVAPGPIQNGNPDGIALVGPSPSTAVVQFLSYGGLFTATDGPASGMASTNIGVAEASSAAVGTSLQLGGTGSVYGDFTWNASADDKFGECNIGQTFTGGVDNAPRVTATVPADGATGVAMNASLSVSFSESVTTSGEWFSINCPVTGDRQVGDTVIGGSGASRTIDPNADFAFDEACTVTIEPANVVDQDGTPDALATSHRFTFTTVPAPVDVRPTVDTTVPANGSTSVATNATLTVKFTEVVTTGGAAFSLRCGSPLQPREFAFAGAGSTYTLDPVSDFNEVENCEIAIEADLVFDQDGMAEQMVADFLATFTTRAGVGSYYDSVDASSCVALRTSLHDLVEDHTVRPYTGVDPDVWTMIEDGDEDPSVAGRVLDIYFNKSFDAPEDRDQGSGAQGEKYNREHTWPQSRGFPTENGNLGFPNAPRSDGHHLFASEKQWNADRGNRPFADCSPNPPTSCNSRYTLTHPVTGGAGSAAACNYVTGNCNYVRGSDDNTGSFEVWSRRRGDVARGVLYMDVRYEGGVAGSGSNTPGQAEPDLVLTNDRALMQLVSGGTAYMGLKSTLLAWHAADPADAYEALRNDAIFSYQGNRNPFVDHPEWVAIAFEEPCGGAPPANQPPIFANASRVVLENATNGTTVATLVATDPNAGQQLSYAIVSGNTGGAFALTPSGSLTVANASLVDPAVAPSYSLLVRATDNGTPAMSDDATISVNVTAVNDAPSFAKGADTSVAEDAGPQAIPSWASAISPGPSDETAQTVSFDLTTNTNTGLFVVAPAVAANGTLTFTAAANASGSAAITLRARDTGGSANGGVDASPTQSFVITVTAIDDVAIANDDAATVGEDSGANSIAVLGNDSDVDGGAFVVTNVTAVTGGTTAVEASGANVTFTPNANFCGATSFDYTISGGDTATVTVVVACINDAPIAIDANGTILAGSPAGTVVASVAASDADSATLKWTIASGNTGGAFAIDPGTGVLTVAIPGAVQATSSPFALVVTVSDDSAPAQTDTATVDITVTPRGDALFSNGFEGP